MSGQFKNTCLFCKATEATNEHLFPDWLGREVNIKSKRTTRFKSLYNIYTGESTHSEYSTGRPITSLKLKKFCQKCNGGWMSQLEDKMKLIYLKFHKSNYAVNISQEETQTICSWATLLTMKWLMHQGYKIVTTNDIEHYYEFRTPPKNWQIWIGHFQGDEDVTTLTTPALFADHNEFNDPSTHEQEINAQSSIFGLGPLFIHVITCQPEHEKLFNNKIYSKIKDIVKIWPNPPKKLHVPFRAWKKIDTDTARILSGTFGDGLLETCEAMAKIFQSKRSEAT
ncbi:hypothetical protein D3C77_327280 [compost metagenome]